MSKRNERVKSRANTGQRIGAGVPCINCGEITELRYHKEITERELSRPFYYSQWYKCTDPSCKTTIFMEEKDKVINKGKTTRGMLKWQERQQQNSFFKSL
jgi:hypothetical protein